MHVVLRVLQISAFMLTSSAAAVTETLPARELVERCESFSRDATSVAGGLCDSYIRGSIAGRSVQGIMQIAADTESRETFAARAARTRIGMRLGATRSRPEVCLPAETSINELVGRLLSHGEQQELDGLAAKHLLDRMLAAEYPCER